MQPVVQNNSNQRVVEGREQADVGVMFDRIARRYDLANRLLSMGIDQSWRFRALRSLGDLSGKTHLDVACGTGDLLWLSERINHPNHRIGLDYSIGMMQYGKRKHPTAPVEWIHGSADALPLEDGSVDAITIAFGIRNVAKFQTALAEFHRTLSANGRVAVLEFSVPANPVWRFIFGSYFRYILPWLGGLLSGNLDAYRYLPASVAKFPYGGAFCNCLTEAGFRDVQAFPLTGGVATLYTGTK